MPVTTIIISVRVSSVETCVCNKSGPLDNFIWKLMIKRARYIALPDLYIHVLHLSRNSEFFFKTLSYGLFKLELSHGFEDESCNYC